MKIKPASGKSITMFEVSDDEKMKQYDYKTDGKYNQLFMDFIASLGFDVVISKDSVYFGNFTIDGVEFTIDDSSASFMGQNAFSRIAAQRKPANRFIRLAPRYGDYTVARVYINKETDKACLIAKIEAAIQKRKDIDQQIDNRHKSDEANTRAIAAHYKAIADKYSVEQLNVSQGSMSLYIRGYASVSLDMTGRITEFDFHKTDKDEADPIAWIQKLQKNLPTSETMMNELKALNMLPSKIQEWGIQIHHQHYSYKTDKYGI